MEGGIWRPEAGGDVEAATSTGGEQLQAILAGYAAARRGGGGDSAGIGEAVTRRSSLWNWPSGNHFQLRLGPAIVTAEGK